MGRSATRQIARVKAPDPLEIYGMPGHLIRRMHQVSTAIFIADTAAAGFDLTSVQYAALTVIAACPGLDQATLASAIAYDRATIGGVIDRLEQKGLVRREIAGGDRRARRLHLLPAGTALLKRVTPIVRRAQTKMLAGLSEKEGATLLRLLRKTLDAVGDLSRAPLRPLSPA
jgi:DNA-binding MarR family transcriptional regulator